jgi:hypothetical protein
MEQVKPGRFTHSDLLEPLLLLARLPLSLFYLLEMAEVEVDQTAAEVAAAEVVQEEYILTLP